MHGPAGVALVNPLRGGFEVRAVPGLIAERPDDDRGMIFVALDHAHGAVHVGIGPIRVLGQGLLAVAHAVAFDIGFVDEVNAVAVAEVVPGGLVGIMAACGRR